MKTKLSTIILCMTIFLSACQKESTNLDLDAQLENTLAIASGESKEAFILPESNDLANIPQDPLNPLTQAKIDLGKMLFHETGLAVNPLHPENAGSYSCASCHFASAGFQANRHQGIGDGGSGFGRNGLDRAPDNLYDLSDLDVQPIRTPSAMNGAFQKNHLWNGQFGGTGVNLGTETKWTTGTPKEVNNLGFEGLETQAIAGLKVHRMDDIASFLKEFYAEDFDAAFPESPVDNRCNRINSGLAIAAYERTLLPTDAPFQKWLKGNANAMNEQEKEGAILFFGKAKCVSCHNGPALNSMEFHGLGMHDLHSNIEATYGASDASEANLGRGGFTKIATEYYKFKVPQLYNLADSPFYGHGASFQNLAMLVSYKNEAIPENAAVPKSQISDEFVPLHLTDDEIINLVAFLENGLRDKNLSRFEPTEVHSNQCFPVNDAVSNIDLGCE